MGNTIAVIALPWFVLSTTGSAARTGLIAFFATLPIAVGSLSAGALVDRIGARRMSILSDALSAVAVAAIPVLYSADALSFWLLAALAFAGALFDGPGEAARQALLPELAREAGMPLERANSLFTATEHVSYIGGAPLAGILIAAVLGAGHAVARRHLVRGVRRGRAARRALGAARRGLGPSPLSQ